MLSRQQTKFNLAEALRAACKGRVAEGESLAKHASLRVGGNAECWFEPVDRADLGVGLTVARKAGKRITVFGGGSNVLVADEGLEGLTVHLKEKAFQRLEMLSNGHVMAGAAVPLASFLKFLVENGLGDCEYLMGVPAQVGGAIAMNAGGGKRWIGENFVRGWRITFDGKEEEFGVKEAGFEYRSSALRDCVICEVEFNFPKKNQEETRKNLLQYSEYRRKTQDLKFPSAGCMFRNPPDKSAGQLIDEAGLKGFVIGGARISTVHANFVVNAGGASFQDVLGVIRHAEEVVKTKFGIQLQREIKVVQ